MMSQTAAFQPYSPAAYAAAARKGHRLFTSRVKNEGEDEPPNAHAVQQMMLYTLRNARKALELAKNTDDEHYSELETLEHNVINSRDAFDQHFSENESDEDDADEQAAKEPPRILEHFKQLIGDGIQKGDSCHHVIQPQPRAVP